MTVTVVVPDLPAGVPCRGADAGRWAFAILQEAGAPTADVNVYALAGWFAREGGGGRNNPLNTTLHTRGSVGAINSAGVQDYDNPPDGVAATVETLHGYPAIILSLRDRRGLTGTGVAGELREWSGGGYDLIVPVTVPIPETPAAGVFTAAIALAEDGKWTVRPTRNSSGVHLGGPDQWHHVTVAVNRRSGEWRIG